MSVVDRLPPPLPLKVKRFTATIPLADHAQWVRTAPGAANVWRALALCLGDTLAVAGAVGIGAAFAALMQAGPMMGNGGNAAMRQPWLWMLLIYAGLIWHFASRGHYDHRNDFSSECRDVAIGCGGGAVLTGFAAYLLGQNVPPVLLIGGMAAMALLVPLFRLATKRVLGRAGLWRVKVVVVGSGAWRDIASGALQSARRLGYEVVGHAGQEFLHAAPRHAPWRRMLAQHGARMVVLAFDQDHLPPAGLAASLVRERVPFAVMPALDGLPVAGCRQTHFVNEDAVIQSYRNNLDRPVARLVKIVFDLASASAALIVLAPVLIAIAAIVSLDGGPVLYGHSRIGAGGRSFRCLKFRSMVTDGDAVLARLLAQDHDAAEEWAATHKLRSDPRVTWIGRMLRTTSLDELPQLLNVIRLEMSLVGPRPIVSQEVPRYAEDIAYYYETRPGITGLWQVSGRSDTSYAQRVRMDSWYVKNWSLWQDVAILLRTVPAVLSGRGAG